MFGRGHNDWVSRAASINRGKLYIGLASSLIVFSGAAVVLNGSGNNSRLSAEQTNSSEPVSGTQVDVSTTAPQDVSNNDTNNSVDTKTENGQTSVTVNGQPVAVPKNGSVHTTVPGNGTNDVDVTVSNDSGNTFVNTFSSSNTSVNSNGTSSNSSSVSSQTVINNGSGQ